MLDTELYPEYYDNMLLCAERRKFSHGYQWTQLKTHLSSTGISTLAVNSNTYRL